ncbi:MAG: hypothetical protein RL367_2123 [Pseudomonadota bacterium]
MNTLPGISLYGQDRLDPDTFVANFVARQNLLAIILAELSRAAKGGTVHHLLIAGTRGMGKSTLLRRVAIAVRTDAVLSASLLPLRFREEQYNVNSLDAFWRNCGEALADWAESNGQEELAKELDHAINTPDWRDDAMAAIAFLKACDRAGARAVLLVDNLDLILDGLSDDEQWRLRGVLQSTTGPIMIGAATRLPGQMADREQPFYEFFYPHFLEPLTEAELFECIRSIASRRGESGAAVLKIAKSEPERLRTLYTLTGGNPRILVLIYQLLERMDTNQVVDDLEALLDQVTPYYKARIEQYATGQQRAVIDAIALNWDPILSRAIADATGIEITTVSTHLNRLRRDGFVEEVETSGARAGYQITERFLNIWYLMRHGTRRGKSRLKWLAKFLSRFFNAQEVSEMADHVRASAAYHPTIAAAVLDAEQLSLGEVRQVKTGMVMEDRDDESALAEIAAASARLSHTSVPDMSPIRLALREAAFELEANNMGRSSGALYRALSLDLETDSWSFADDLLRYLGLAEASGHGEAIIGWFETSGMNDNYAPVYAAFVAYVRGERFLLDFNPEVRGPAQVMYDTLSAPRPYQQKQLPLKPKTTRGRSRTRRGRG